MTTYSHHAASLFTPPEDARWRLRGTLWYPPVQSQDAVAVSCRATSAEGRPRDADNDVSGPRSGVAMSRGSHTTVPASGPTAVVTTEADTRTGMLATYGSASSRRVCGMDAADMLPNAVAAGRVFDARPQHHQVAGDVGADGAHRSGWSTCSSGPTIDFAPQQVAGRPGIMRPTCWSHATVFR